MIFALVYVYVAKTLASFESQHNNIKTEKEVNMYKRRPLYYRRFSILRDGCLIQLLKNPCIPPHERCKDCEFSKKTEDAAVLFVKKVLSARALLARVNGH